MILCWIAFCGLFGGTAHAGLPMTSGTMTLTGVTGFTRIEFPADGTGAASRPVIYAGMSNQGGCTGTSVCDSCSLAGPTGEKFYPCNRASVFPSLKMHFDLTSTTTSTTIGSGDVFVKTGAGTSGLSTSGTYNATTKTASIDIGWDQICLGLGNSSCLLTAPARATFSVGIGAVGSSTDKFDFDVVFSYVDVAGSTTFTEACTESGVLSTTAPAVGNYGACYYKATRGDGKIYIQPITNASTYPVFQGAINYGGLEVFYAEGAKGDPPDNIVQSIETKTAKHASLDMGTGATSVSENRINGLNNGSQYCFVVANKDVTGNIFYYAPVTGTTPPAGTNVDSQTICAVPNVVVGLLDDKSCFIATAAFGSDMAPEVQTFRNFRNKFLLNSAWGRAFVKTYYKLSPPVANFIAEHEILRSISRGILWPVLMFVKLTLEWGILIAALAAAIFTILMIEALRRLRSVRTSRKAA